MKGDVENRFLKAYMEAEKQACNELFSNENKAFLWDVMLQMKPSIYAVLFNPMIHESTWGVISLHKTLKGAEITLAHHKHNIEKEEGAEYCNRMDWRIEKMELEE